MREKRKKLMWKGRILLLMLLLMQLFSINGIAAISDDTSVDFVLVLDCSGSLNESDKERLSVSAAKMFVDMLPAENARLAVIAFGDDYGDTAYIVEGSQGSYSEKRVSVAYALQNISGQNEKESAKETISTVTAISEDGDATYTPIGYALQAACEVLEKGEAEEDSASIILLSDGRVSGQNDGYDGAYEYTSIDKAVEKASAKGWPIYCLELNYDQENKENAASAGGNIGYHQMRQIPKKTNAAHIEMTSPTEAQNAFAEIFAKFFDAEPTTASGTIEDGKVSLNFKIGEMVAETNLTLTGQVSEVEKIVIRNSDGKETEYTKSVTEQSRIITYGDKYSTAKLMTPKAGEWTITAYGTNGVEIGLYAVSIREMNLQLSALTDRVDGSTGILPKGSVVDFTASYIYNGGTYSSDTFYRESTAYLVVEETGEKVTLTGGDDNYKGTLAFNNSGTYTVKACVESDMFRNDKKESGSYTFTVGNLPLTLTGSIADVQMNVGGTYEIDCTQYFKNEDNDIITYKVNVDQTADISHTLSKSGVMTLTAGEKSGTYQFTISANDGGMDKDIEQSFNVSVVNQPLTATGEDEASLIFTYNASALPDFILNACGIDTNADAELLWSDFFNDPDGLPMDITVTATEDDGVIKLEQSAEKMYVSAEAKGKAVYTVTVADGSDASVSYTMTVKVSSLNAMEMVWQKIKVMVIMILVILVAILVLIIYAFAGRKIYGKWDVITSEQTLKDRRFFITGAGKHAKCSMNRLLKDLNLHGDFPGVEFIAGNNLNKKVTMRGFEKMTEVMVNGNRVTDPARLRKLSVSIRKGKSITLISPSGIKVKFERKA